MLPLHTAGLSLSFQASGLWVFGGPGGLWGSKDVGDGVKISRESHGPQPTSPFVGGLRVWSGTGLEDVAALRIFRETAGSACERLPSRGALRCLELGIGLGTLGGF